MIDNVTGENHRQGRVEVICGSMVLGKKKITAAGAFAKQRKGGDIDAEMLNRLVRGDRKSAAT